MNEGWLLNALGEGWLLKILGVLLVPISAIAGWIMRRPMEKAGIRHQLDVSMEAHLKELREDIDRLRRERREDQEDCDRQLADLKGQIDAMLSGAIPTYIFGGKEGRSFAPKKDEDQ